MIDSGKNTDIKGFDKIQLGSFRRQPTGGLRAGTSIWGPYLSSDLLQGL